MFVLGDNRGHSTDSRFQSVGMVDQRNILGKVVFNIYPFSNLGFVS
ncbi:MAG: S26 family signal peptidase [Acutalibacter sp.]